MTRININLLGVERKEALERKGLPIDKGWLFSGGAIIASALLLLLLNGLLSSWVANAEDQKALNEQEIAELDKKLKEIKDLETERNNLKMEEKILRYVTGETYRWSYLLQEVRALMPLDVKINDLKFSADGTFTLSGTATDHRSVALFLASLQSSKMLTNVVLGSSVKAAPEEPTTFEIRCKINVIASESK